MLSPACLMIVLATSCAALVPHAGAPLALRQGPRPLLLQPGQPLAAGLAQPVLCSRGRSVAPRMGLFGLGWAEIGAIGVLALFLLGPDRLVPYAKEFGKSAGSLKEVADSFQEGLSEGTRAAGEAREVEVVAPPAMAPAADTPLKEASEVVVVEADKKCARIVQRAGQSRPTLRAGLGPSG